MINIAQVYYGMDIMDIMAYFDGFFFVNSCVKIADLEWTPKKVQRKFSTTLELYFTHFYILLFSFLFWGFQIEEEGFSQ